MKKFCYLILLVTSFGIAQKTDTLTTYAGIFKHRSFKTDLEFEIQNVNNQYTVKFNSLSQNAIGIPAGNIVHAGDTLKFALQSDFYRYDFSIFSFPQNQLKGQLKVDNNLYGFDLAKVSKENDNEITHKDIRFKSEGLFLYGTIYYPYKPNGKAIYLVTSSGDQDRSSSRSEAILFAKAGFISFHIDKRGTGISDGNWHLADIPDLCKDDLHALEFLHQSEKISYKNIGIKGSSQGATKIPYLLKKQPNLAYGIAVSCPASTLLESDWNYWKNRNRDQIKPEYFENASQLQKSVFHYISGELTQQELEDKIKSSQSEEWFSKVWIPELDQVEIDKKLTYSPLPYFENNSSAILLIEGTEDMIIPNGSMKSIKDIIGKKGNKKNKFISLKEADHSMMLKGETDFPYWSSLHPKYFSSMLKWIKKQ